MEQKIMRLPYNNVIESTTIHKYFRTAFGTPLFSSQHAAPVYCTPFQTYFCFKDQEGVYYCYILEKYWKKFCKQVKEGSMRGENGEVLTPALVNDYLVSYAKGFGKGYSEYVDHVKQSEVFQLTNEDVAYKIFTRVFPAERIDDGDITMFLAEYDNQNRHRSYISKDFFYEIGYEGGEFYKAWEIILSTPTQFEKLFDSWQVNDLDSHAIVPVEYTGIIFRKYKNFFVGETKEMWNKRFVYPASEFVPPISISKSATEGSSRLILIAILACIQDVRTTNNFDFAQFVKDRFGVLNFYKAKCEHQQKHSYIDTYNWCKSILSK
jgi:hypothetical protein